VPRVQEKRRATIATTGNLKVMFDFIT
jgi:hypothetical protein